MSNAAATTMDVIPARSFAGHFTFAKIGLLFAVCSLVLLDGVNGAACSTVGKYLMGSFATTSDQITWAAIFYYVGKLYMLLFAAKMQALFGQRRAYLGTSIALVLATAAGAFVSNYPSLLAVLLLQGAAGGLMIALGQGVLLAIFPRREQPLVQGAYALAAVMFPATIVPEIWGGFAYNLDWRYAYLFMTPIGLAGCGWLLWNRKMLSNSVNPVPLSIVRIILVVTALFSIVYVLQQGNRNRWLEYPPIVWALLLAAACIVWIAFIETSGRPTLLEYSAFQYANFTFGSCVVIIAGISLFGSGYVISGFLSNVLSYPVSQSGFIQLSGTVFSIISFLAVGVIIRFTKIPPIIFLLFGLLLFGISMWHLGLAPSDSSFESLVPWLVMRAFAFGCQFIPLTLLALTCLPAKDDVSAAGIFNFNRQLGALIGIAWLQSLLEHLTDRNQTVFGNALSSTNPNVMAYAQAVQQALSLDGAAPAQAPPAATALVLQEAHRQWASIAFNGCFEWLSIAFLVFFPLTAAARILTARYLKPACH